MMTLDEATNVAAFANSHDGGVTQPRAEVFALNIPKRYGVHIRSLTLVTSGNKRWTEVDTDLVYSRRGALNVLGY
jgi:hypothetical protein